MLNRAAQELGKAVERKKCRIDAMGTTAWNTRDKPTEHGPDGDEQKCKAAPRGHPKEAHHRVARSRFEANFASDAIGTLDAKPTSIASIGNVSRPVEIDDDQEQPFAASLAIFAWRQRCDHGDFGFRPIGKGVGGAIALAALAELMGASLLAADGTSQYSWLLLLLEIVNDFARAEALVEVEHIELQTQGLQLLVKAFDDSKDAVRR